MSSGCDLEYRARCGRIKIRVSFRARSLPQSGLAFILGATGLSTMAFALLLEGNALEPLVTSAGSLTLAAAHLLNWRGRRHSHV